MTVTTTPARTVTRRWETTLATHAVDLSGIVWDDGVRDHLAAEGPSFETIPTGTVLTDPAALEHVFLATMTLLASRTAASGAPTGVPEQVALTAQVWRGGYEVPMAASRAEFCGWCVLAATPPETSGSGDVAILDPRAGCAMTATPGLPWGREFVFSPAPGGLLVLPGWLTSSVRPLERGQTIVVVAAESRP